MQSVFRYADESFYFVRYIFIGGGYRTWKDVGVRPEVTTYTKKIRSRRRIVVVLIYFI